MEQSSVKDQSHGGHVKNQESISDYIAYYGNDDWTRSSRPLSFIPGSHDETTLSHSFDPSTRTGDSLLVRSLATERYPHGANGTSMEQQNRRSASNGSQNDNLTRSPSGTATQAFPLNDLDYESSAAAVAQELSNLHAIRRMSMNVDAADPDLPTFLHGPSLTSPIPSPPGTEDEDASRLFWVPARLHPELAPKDYKTFMEDRVDRIRRRAGSDASLPPEGLGFDRKGSIGGLQRQKSTLSRTIDSGVGYKDGSEIIERKKSQSGKSMLDQSETSLQELETLVNDHAQVGRPFDADASRQAGSFEDNLPAPPTSLGGLGLKRSTRTNYRNTSLRKGERISAGRRPPGRLSDDGGTPRDSGVAERDSVEGPRSFELVRSSTEPVSPGVSNDTSTSKDRPPDRVLQHAASMDTLQPAMQTLNVSKQKQPTQFHSRIASNGRTTAQTPAPIPTIVETPPPPDNTQPPQKQHIIPARSSSHDYSRTEAAQNAFGDRPALRPSFSRTSSFNTTLDDMAKNPSMMIGANTRTDDVTFIPTLHEQKPEKPDKPDKATNKKLKDRKDGDSGTRKTSWGWLLGGEDKEKKEKDKEEREAGKKRGKLIKLQSEKPQDIVRLDVLQTATEDIKSRESLVLNRDDLKLDEERKKESNRKSGGSDGKKEKEGRLFSSLFGGKKKGEREAAKQSKALADRAVSPEPPRMLRADIDYNWTRFSILEERAIYRMAHIKLANPRRALYSQVLLSNFMYSYLAKVQQMHPQIQIPQFVQQKQQQQQQSQQQQQQMQQQQQLQHQQLQHQQLQQQQLQQELKNPNDEFAQWQRYQEQNNNKPSYSSPYDSQSTTSSNSSSQSPAIIAAMSQHSAVQQHSPHTPYIDYDDADQQQQQQPDPWSYDYHENSGGDVDNNSNNNSQQGRRPHQGSQPQQDQGQHQHQQRRHPGSGGYWDQRSQRDRRYEEQGMFAQGEQGGGRGGKDMW